MRFLGIIFSVILASGCLSQKKKPKITPMSVVVITLTQTSMWCGGARPSEDMEKELATPQPLPNYLLYVRRDFNDISSPILYTLKTDSVGQVRLKLQPGKYSVVNKNKKDLTLYKSVINKYRLKTENYSEIDKDCYDKYITEPDFIIEVPTIISKIIEVNHNYRNLCSWYAIPCINYIGPMPP